MWIVDSHVCVCDYEEDEKNQNIFGGQRYRIDAGRRNNLHLLASNEVLIQ